MKIDKNKKILLDADVLIHFYKGEILGTLTQIFSNKLYILKQVLDEVYRGAIRTQIENLIQFKLLTEIDFSTDLRVLQEYAKLKKEFGSGESACMAYCKFHKDVLASSNLRDIKGYCELNQIQYLTTMDFINQAYEKSVLNEAECDLFIYNVKLKGSKLPFHTLKEFRISKGY